MVLISLFIFEISIFQEFHPTDILSLETKSDPEEYESTIPDYNDVINRVQFSSQEPLVNKRASINTLKATCTKYAHDHFGTRVYYYSRQQVPYMSTLFEYSIRKQLLESYSSAQSLTTGSRLEQSLFKFSSL